MALTTERPPTKLSEIAYDPLQRVSTICKVHSQSHRSRLIRFTSRFVLARTVRGLGKAKRLLLCAEPHGAWFTAYILTVLAGMSPIRGMA